MKLKFKYWLENLDDIISIQNPEEIAKHWHANLPEEQPQQNPIAVNIFAKAMAEASSGTNLARHLARYEVHDLAYPDKPISNNLLSISDDRLKDARGYITNQESSEFSFFMGGSHAGMLLIQHQPVVYDADDVVLMKSVINHELGHAIDWLNPKFKSVQASGRFRLNAQAYAENVHEARRYSDQLRYLFKQVGDAGKVMNMLSKAGPAQLAPALMTTAQEFLREYIKELKEDINPAGFVISQQNEYAKTAVNLICKIVQMMRLKNFVQF